MIPASASPTSTPSPSGVAGWRILLRIFGALFAVVVFSWWAAAGANTGFTKDRIAIKKTDEITGIEYVEYQEHFLPGLEYLVPAMGIGLALIAVTFLPSRKTKHTS